jgi:hypothetical protein
MKSLIFDFFFSKKMYVTKKNIITKFFLKTRNVMCFTNENKIPKEKFIYSKIFLFFFCVFYF